MRAFWLSFALVVSKKLGVLEWEIWLHPPSRTEMFKWLLLVYLMLGSQETGNPELMPPALEESSTCRHTPSKASKDGTPDPKADNDGNNAEGERSSTDKLAEVKARVRTNDKLMCVDTDSGDAVPVFFDRMCDEEYHGKAHILPDHFYGRYTLRQACGQFKWKEVDPEMTLDTWKALRVKRVPAEPPPPEPQVKTESGDQSEDQSDGSGAKPLETHEPNEQGKKPATVAPSTSVQAKWSPGFFGAVDCEGGLPFVLCCAQTCTCILLKCAHLIGGFSGEVISVKRTKAGAHLLTVKNGECLKHASWAPGLCEQGCTLQFVVVIVL